jgi:hypothetical protein
MVRSVVALIIGFAAVVVLALAADSLVRQLVPDLFDSSGGTKNTALLAFAIAYVSLFAVVGSWLTARLAPNHPMGHALLLGGISFVLSIGVTISQWNAAPTWYHVGSLLVILPSASLGGWLRSRHMTQFGRGRDQAHG